VVDEAEKRLPVTVDVDEIDRLVVQAELRPCQHLEEFVERARPAGQHGDGMGIHVHHLLALMHVLGDDVAREVGAALLAWQQVHRNDAEAFRARRRRGVGHCPHQPDIARAVDKLPALGRDRGAKLDRGGGIGRVVARAGATEDADRKAGWGHGGTRGKVLTVHNGVDKVAQALRG